MTAHHEIEEALLSYCRGIDRLDAAAILAAFHPEAVLHQYGPEPMPIETFADQVIVALEKRYLATQHRISNVSVEVHPEMSTVARVETYVLAFHRAPGEAEAPDLLHTFNGRYIDRFEQRDDRWKIARRTLRTDWSKVEPIEQPMRGSWVASGRAGSADPLDDW